MKKTLFSGLALSLGLAAPMLALATNSNYYDSDYYNSYDYGTSASDSAAGAVFGIGFLIFFGVLMLIGLAFFIFEIFMIVDCLKRDFEQRTVWLVVLIVGLFFGFGWIASIIYFFVVKHKNVGTKKMATPVAPPAQKQ